ncbi:MAG: NAD-dependent deacylase [Pseudomonadota bacterium]
MKSGRIVILTGAGISAESGLGTFRDVGGIWTQYDVAEVATPEGFARDPALVRRFYDARRENALAASPNAAHHALARLEAAMGDRLTLITQNIDTLHEAAGHRRVWHMHGRIDRARCADCGSVTPWAGPMTAEDTCGDCNAVGRLRPDVVWFGEMPMMLEDIADALACADLFVAIGTSGAVYPAAGFVADARVQGAKTLELNLERSDVTSLFDETRLGPASDLVPRWVDELTG